MVCFHAQQCVEKSLKAFLTSVDRHVEKTHDLTKLVELCRDLDQDFRDIKNIAVELVDYSVSTRYPDAWRDIPPDEAAAAVLSAKEALKFVKNKIGI